VNNSAVDYSISIRFCIKSYRVTLEIAVKVLSQAVKGQGHSMI